MQSAKCKVQSAELGLLNGYAENPKECHCEEPAKGGDVAISRNTAHNQRKRKG